MASNMTIIFSNSAPNLFALHETLHINKFEGGDLKYDNTFFEIPVQKCQNKASLVPNLILFL